MIALARAGVLLLGVTPAINLWQLSASIGVLLGTGRGALWGPRTQSFSGRSAQEA